MVKISIVTPVYNVKPYLNRCVSSLLNQTFKNDYEIVFVNDGSTDGCGELLDKLAKAYPNMIKVIHQENRGLSEARNTALKYVNGEYTLFCDADDYIASNSLEELYNYAQKHNSEVVIFDFIRKNFESANIVLHHFDNIYKKYGDTSFNAETSEPFVYRFVPVATWAKFYMTDLIKDLKFEKGLINEDVVHWARVWTKAKRVNYFPKPFYFYIVNRVNSISSYNDKRVFDLFKVFSIAKDVLDNAGFFDKYRYIHYAHFASNIRAKLCKIHPSLRRDFIKEIQNYEIDICYNDFYKLDFFNFEKKDMRLLSFIRENCYDNIEKALNNIRIWE